MDIQRCGDRMLVAIAALGQFRYITQDCGLVVADDVELTIVGQTVRVFGQYLSHTLINSTWVQLFQYRE